MKVKAKRPRLKKGPDIQDYVVEIINGGSKQYNYFMLRSDARAASKRAIERGAERVRVFRISFKLVSDKKN